jgi:capsular polysaccharide biosynthesis protein
MVHGIMNAIKRCAGWLPPPVACEPLLRMAERAGVAVDCQRPAGEERTDFGHIEDAETREYFLKHAVSRYVPEYRACLPGAMSYGYGAVLSADGRSLARDVTPDFGNDERSHWMLHRDRLLPRPRNLRGTTLVMAHNVSANYFHWLLEEVPRCFGLALDSYDHIIASGFTAAQREMLRLLGIGNDRLLEPRGYCGYRAGHLVIPAIPGRIAGGDHCDETVPRMDTLTALRELAAGMLEEADSRRGLGSSGYPEKILVSRSRAPSRRLANETEVHAVLKEKGFTLVHLEDMGLRQQAQLFARAKVVVAPHGAALANLVFCKAGTTVVELFTRGYLKCMYGHLAVRLGLRYLPLVERGGECLAATDAPRDMRLDPREIAACLH